MHGDSAERCTAAKRCSFSVVELLHTNDVVAMVCHHCLNPLCRSYMCTARPPRAHPTRRVDVDRYGLRTAHVTASSSAYAACVMRLLEGFNWSTFA
eukprot:2199746-Pleurochrysis_carterae.AAC.1